MRFLKGLLGVIIIIFGSLLIAITIDDALIKNIILRIVGAIFLYFGASTLHRQIHPNKYKKDQAQN